MLQAIGVLQIRKLANYLRCAALLARFWPDKLAHLGLSHLSALRGSCTLKGGGGRSFSPGGRGGRDGGRGTLTLESALLLSHSFFCSTQSTLVQCAKLIAITRVLCATGAGRGRGGGRDGGRGNLQFMVALLLSHSSSFFRFVASVLRHTHSCQMGRVHHRRWTRWPRWP